MKPELRAVIADLEEQGIEGSLRAKVYRQVRDDRVVFESVSYTILAEFPDGEQIEISDVELHEEEIVDATPPDPDELLESGADATDPEFEEPPDDSPRQPAEPPASTDAAPAAPSPQIQQPRISCGLCGKSKLRKGSRKQDDGRMICADCREGKEPAEPPPAVETATFPCLECGKPVDDGAGGEFCSLECKVDFEKAEMAEADV